MADLAIWMAGHVSVPIYPSLRAESVRHIAEHSGLKGCFIGATDERESTGLGIPPGVRRMYFPTSGASGGPFWDDLLVAGPARTATPVRPASDIATIIYTSGTTGLPKGVIHSFAALAYDARRLAEFLDFTSEERAISYLPLAHIVERAGLEGTALFCGYQVFFAERVDTFLADLHRARPTIFLSVPRLLLKFQQGVFAHTPKEKLDRLLRLALIRRYVKGRVLRKLGLDSVRFAACGAAPLPPELLLWYRNLGLELEEGYGMTEVLITHLGRRGSVQPGSVGSPLEGVEQKLGENSELLIKSPMNMLGYYRDPEGTASAFTSDGFFRTGDVAAIWPDGRVSIVGRVKEQFKTSKGKYVAPAPIENRLVSHPAVEACCLMGAGLPSPFAVALLSAEERKRCVQPKMRQALEQSLRTRIAEVNAQLDAHERVSFVVIADGPWSVSNGLLTPTLKVKRMALETRYLKLIEEWKGERDTVLWESAP